MGGDDYTSAVGGGLKLKGSKPTGIKKKKSKSKTPSTTAVTTTTTGTSSTLTKRTSSASPPPSGPTTDTKDTSTPASASASAKDEEDALWRQVEEQDGEQNYKTPTEKRHEEMRRKRLEDRLKREGGGRTHKQRVEELNRYLSGLSEHHDMPRIGPG